ncbi:MAG: tetratricopeptide repeat protein [Deltaproteobacteria bacterium]|nr:tetratricopeptide repeat protein [Deltaproteobacteria bacterium]
MKSAFIRIILIAYLLAAYICGSASAETKTAGDADAVAAYSKAIKEHPDDAASYIKRGIVYGKQGNYNLAIADFNKAVELNPQSPDAYFYRGAAYYILVNFKQAIADYSKAIELNPDDARIYAVRGSAYNELGNDKQALEDMKAAARLGLKEAQRILIAEGVDWNEGVPKTTRSEGSTAKRAEKPGPAVLKPPEKAESAVGRDKSIPEPDKKAEPEIAADPRYKAVSSIVMPNGDVIEGQILRMDDDAVTIRTKDGHISRIPLK